MERNISVIKDVNGNQIVVINDIRFKGRQNIDLDGTGMIHDLPFRFLMTMERFCAIMCFMWSLL